MDKWLKTGTHKRSTSRTEIRTTDLAAMEITVDQQDDNREGQRPTNWSVQQHEGYFGTDFLILKRGGQMTRTTPELAPPLQTSAPHQREDVWPTTYDLACNRPNTRRIFSGIGFRTWIPPAPKPKACN
ncbi:hypothetical protein AVEN_218808-1 [Araneus ventricosus]|uniref:Uncharacterized protein n=1 Tax=Araneus ventricosus TaxID=182803 RepID=A0A4Y2B711_ARAVE|nr:hypothetical protein AVEN_218808-1 [Araneus ventricosus]